MRLRLIRDVRYRMRYYEPEMRCLLSIKVVTSTYCYISVDDSGCSLYTFCPIANDQATDTIPTSYITTSITAPYPSYLLPISYTYCPCPYHYYYAIYSICLVMTIDHVLPPISHLLTIIRCYRQWCILDLYSNTVVQSICALPYSNSY